MMFIINQAKFQTHLPDKSNLSTLSTAPIYEDSFFIFIKYYVVVVIGTVEKWIGPLNSERFRYEIHGKEPVEMLKAMWITYPHGG